MHAMRIIQGGPSVISESALVRQPIFSGEVRIGLEGLAGNERNIFRCSLCRFLNGEAGGLRDILGGRAFVDRRFRAAAGGQREQCGNRERAARL